MHEDIVYLILSVVNEVPPGKVSCYGQIAKVSGYPKNARLVGNILSHADYYGDFPCHRVVHSDGRLVEGWDAQEQLLRQEGITFLKNGKVDMKRHLWEVDNGM